MIIVDSTSFVPPYEQIRAQLAAEIANGTLAAGARLPTVRRMAEDLGVAVNTVARAYRELEAAELVETRGRGGTTVTAGGDRTRERVVDAARQYASFAREVGLSPQEAHSIVRAALSV